MKRRKALKLMAASIPVLATTGFSTVRDTLSATAADTKALNLVFEGPLVLNLEGSQAHVMAPAASGHVYQIAGQPAVQGTYSVAGISGAGNLMKTRFDLPRGADAFRLSASQLNLTLNTRKIPFFKFSLPVPDRIVALSSREAQVVDAFGNTRTALMPTTYAFVYHVTRESDLAVSSVAGWQPQIDLSQAGFANLVVAVGLPLGFQGSNGAPCANRFCRSGELLLRPGHAAYEHRSRDAYRRCRRPSGGTP